MTYYRLYSLGLNDAHITDVFHFSAESDIAAIAEVEAGSRNLPKELWNRARKVMDFAARRSTDMRFELFHEPSNRFTNVIGADGSWRWELLDGRDEVVAYGVGHQTAAECKAAIDTMRNLDSKTPAAELTSN